MKKKFVWLFIYVFVVVIFLITLFSFVKRLNNYFSLNVCATGLFESFEIIETKEERARVLVSYSYKDSNKNLYKKNFETKDFLNSLGAKDYAKRLFDKDLKVFYSKKNPQKSSLKKVFPYKELVYCIITFLVFVYFLVLKIYLLRLQKE